MSSNTLTLRFNSSNSAPEQKAEKNHRKKHHESEENKDSTGLSDDNLVATNSPQDPQSNVDNNLNDEPLYIQFSGYNTGSTVLTYPIYAQSTVDQNFAYSIDGFEGIIAQVTHDKQGTDPWEGNNGNGLLANIYYRP